MHDEPVARRGPEQSCAQLGVVERVPRTTELPTVTVMVVMHRGQGGEKDNSIHAVTITMCYDRKDGVGCIVDIVVVRCIGLDTFQRTPQPDN